MSRSRRVGLVAGVLIAAAVGVAAGLGQGPIEGIGASAIVIAFVAVAEFGSGERSRILAARRDRGDEREVAISNEAAQLAYVAVIAVAVPGWLLGAARGHFNEYGVVCAVAGGVQIVSALWLRARR